MLSGEILTAPAVTFIELGFNALLRVGQRFLLHHLKKQRRSSDCAGTVIGGGGGGDGPKKMFDSIVGFNADDGEKNTQLVTPG